MNAINLKEEGKPVICDIMDGPRGPHAKGHKSGTKKKKRERQMPYDLICRI